MIKKGKTEKGRTSICKRYREILDMPDLTDKKIDPMRKHLGLLARAILERVWKKKFC